MVILLEDRRVVVENDRVFFCPAGIDMLSVCNNTLLEWGTCKQRAKGFILSTLQGGRLRLT